MIKSDNAIHELQKISGYIPKQYHIELHKTVSIKNVEKWRLPHRTIHDFILAYIRNSGAYYILDGKKVEMQKGQIVLISPELYHSAKMIDTTFSLISIRFGIYDNANNEYIEKPSDPFYLSLIPYTNLFHEAFETIYNYSLMIKKDSLYQSLCDSYITYLLNEIILIAKTKDKNVFYDKRLEDAYSYIQNNITDKSLSVENVADKFKLTRPYFSKKFRKYFGITPSHLIFISKMHHAHILLEFSDYNVYQTTIELNYSDQFIFSNQFKRFFGYPPSSLCSGKCINRG